VRLLRAQRRLAGSLVLVVVFAIGLVIGNLEHCDVLRSWLQTLRRQSQNHRMNWERVAARLDPLLPPVTIVHRTLRRQISQHPR
jgi:hypothetical protein